MFRIRSAPAATPPHLPQSLPDGTEKHLDMCYFEQTRWSCGYWKWGNFRQQCTKEYRTGETCGLKLVYDTLYNDTTCKLCEQVEKKERRIEKMNGDIRRWKAEGNRTATIEKTVSDMNEIQNQIHRIWNDHQERERNIA